ncbi:Astacin-like metalloprotease toxin 2 [Araneus ventricosus]|uniref:Metalloendopeptidase n=1 Tax=Araneus ventricosus TaxID=182803 RepID=A0A4Y2KW77_ARAVE|nr:Astacin-like metalloprotease toxin 2 [Araneus ventricosus]
MHTGRKPWKKGDMCTETGPLPLTAVYKKCYSYVGQVPSPQPQPLSLGGGCEYIGTVVHELGHAVGLFHEHQRSDRDTYITVYEKNVAPGSLHNFRKTKPIDELKWATYDYTSIMHYGEYAFSKRRNVLKTMEAKDGKTKLLEPYDRPGLNDNDIDLVKKLYECK